MGLRKRSVLLSGHATSVALEPEFWDVLEAMAAADGLALAGIIGRIDAGRSKQPLASACRLAALAYAGQSSRAGGATGTGAAAPAAAGD